MVTVPNTGINPPDYTTSVGRFRLLAHDTVASDLDPAVPGQGRYVLFSDDEITAYLTMYPSSLLRSVGTAYLSLAGRAAMDAKLIKDYDLQVDLSKRASALAEAAAAYFDRAEADELISGEESSFGITPANTDLSFREIVSLPAEQWAYLEDLDLPIAPDGMPPFYWGR